MFATTGGEMELLADGLLQDLCFLDDRDSEYGQARDDLLKHYGSVGVVGPFVAMFSQFRCQAEVASIYAELFCRLGYFVVDCVVSLSRWAELTTDLLSQFDGRDLLRSEAEELLGAPSLVVDRRVLCYASPRSLDGWVFVDCYQASARKYVPGLARFEVTSDADPPVRSVRRSTGRLKDGLILTQLGQQLRLGPDQ
jgi:hypothetical protein